MDNYILMNVNGLNLETLSQLLEFVASWAHELTVTDFSNYDGRISAELRIARRARFYPHDSLKDLRELRTIVKTCKDIVKRYTLTRDYESTTISIGIWPDDNPRNLHYYTTIYTTDYSLGGQEDKHHRKIRLR